MNREIQSFKPGMFKESGWTLMKCPFCFKRINHQDKVSKLDEPEKYGELTMTHKALYRCRCGETQIIVEGTVETLVLHGCIAVKKHD